MPRHHFDGTQPAPKKPDDPPPIPARSGDGVTGQTPPRENTLGRPVKGLRFLSGLIDLAVIVLLFFLVIIVLTVAGLADGEMEDTEAMIVYTIYLPACFVYGLFMECSRFQGTLGKILTGTVIVNKEGRRISFAQSLGRNFGKWLSYLIPFGISYFMVLFTEKGQTLHDLMAGTLVYKKGDIAQSYAETFS